MKLERFIYLIRRNILAFQNGIERIMISAEDEIMQIKKVAIITTTTFHIFHSRHLNITQ